MLIAFHLRHQSKLSDIYAHWDRELQRPSALLKRRLHGANETSYARNKITRWDRLSRSSGARVPLYLPFRPGNNHPVSISPSHF